MPRDVLGADTGSSVNLTAIGDGDHPVAYGTPLWGVLVDGAKGTATNPQTTPGPIARFSRTGAVTQASIDANASPGTDGGDQLAAIMGVSLGTAAEEVQGVGVAGFASTHSQVGSPGNDACGVYGFGRALSDSVGSLGIGAFFHGRRDSDTGHTTGVEVASGNYTTTDGVLVTNGASLTKGMWINAIGNSDTGAGIQFGNAFGRQFKTVIHFNAQVIGGKTGPGVNESIRDDSTSATSILIKGTHTAAALAVGSGSGPVIIGGESLLLSSNRLEIQTNISADPLFMAHGTTGNLAVSGRVGNGSGSSKWFVSGGINNFITGTAQGDTGMAWVGGKFLMGQLSSTPSITMSNNAVGFLGASPQPRQTVTGSRGGNTALASLLTALATFGLITDSSTT